MEVVEFEQNKIISMIIHDDLGETYGCATFTPLGKWETILTFSVEFPDMDYAKKDFMVCQIERGLNQIKRLAEAVM